MTLDRRQILTALATLGFAATSARAEQMGFDLRLTNEGLMMPVMVRGRPLQGILDCGASATLMDAQVAESLGLDALETRSGQAVYGRITAGESAPVSIRAGDAAYVAPVMILPMKQVGLTADMLIGRDILNDWPLDLDGPARRASFRRQQPAGGMRPVPLSRSPKGALVIDMELEGHPVRASLDTGANTALILRRSWAKRNGLLHGRSQSTALGGDVNGLRRLTLSPVRDIRLGGIAFNDLSAEISDNVLEHDVTVGLEVLRRLHSYWDVSAGKLWLMPPSRGI
ncbi:MAG: retropepsin-like aspartic protease [Asticcacaulis sp.]|uniref:retropepsin-like aspartic protease n=1 Tax=Asticcacaulis sp. TaxID=1872648 RepID=UPI0039E4DDD0